MNITQNNLSSKRSSGQNQIAGFSRLIIQAIDMRHFSSNSLELIDPRFLLIEKASKKYLKQLSLETEIFFF